MLLLLWHCPAEPWGSPTHSVYGYTLTNAFHKVRGLCVCVCVTVLCCCFTWAATYQLQSIYRHCWRGGSCYARGLSWLTRRIGQAAWVGYPWVYPMYWVPCSGCLSPAQDLTSWAGYPTLSHTQDWTGCMSWVPCTSCLCSCTGFDRLGWVPYTFSCTGFDRMHELGTLH